MTVVNDRNTRTVIKRSVLLKAKIAAIESGMTLQDWVEMAITRALIIMVENKDKADAKEG